MSILYTRVACAEAQQAQGNGKRPGKGGGGQTGQAGKAEGKYAQKGKRVGYLAH